LLLENYLQIPKMLTKTFFTIFSFVIGQNIVGARLSLAARKYPWRRRLSEHYSGSFQSTDLIVETLKKTLYSFSDFPFKANI
jgi:hypothetical protein